MEAREVYSILNSLSPERQDNLKRQIELNYSVAKLMGRRIEHRLLSYTETVLVGGKPEPLKHRNPTHRNGIIYGYLWRKK